jgi:ankyrin repeat protein
MTTKKDFHLQSFFLDYEGIMANQDSKFLSKFRKTAENIFNKDLYSDINVQDENGNTFLHHAMYSNLSVWVERILRKGGNPFIDNNEKRNAFQYASKKFKTTYKVNIDEYFQKNTQGFCKEFKQGLFDGSVKTSIYDKSYFYKIDEYLQSIDLVNDKNKINLSYANWPIPIEERIDYYLNNFDSPENNSHFFKLLTHARKDERIFDDKEIVERFLNREFVWDENFKQGLANLIRNTESDDKDTVDALVTGLNIMFDNKFSFKENLEWNISLEDQLLESDSLKPIYMSEKLQHTLQEKSEKKSKVLKI